MGSLSFLRLLLIGHRFRFTDPAFDTDFAVHGVRLRESVVDRGPQSVQRDLPFTIPFST